MPRASQNTGFLRRKNASSRPKRQRISPGRRQYLQFKAKYSDSLLLFRMGDFYECFDEDARTLSRILDVALTARDVGSGVKSPLAGIPYHALDNYIGRLVGAGLKVAIAEQVSSKPGPDGIVERTITRVVTPGTVLDASLLEQTQHNYLAASVIDGDVAGLAWLDASTGEFAAMELPRTTLLDEIERLTPSEILADTRSKDLIRQATQHSASSKSTIADTVIRDLDDAALDADIAADDLMRHFGTSNLDPFELADSTLAVTAAAAALRYLADTQMGNLPFITTLRRHRRDGYMHIGASALRDLEVLEPTTEGGPTLLTTLDRTKTPMGARLLRSWLAAPLLDLNELSMRQIAIEKLHSYSPLRYDLSEALAKTPDLPRIINRIVLRNAGPRDLRALLQGLDQTPQIKSLLQYPGENEPISPLFAGISTHTEVRELIENSIVEDPPLRASDGDVIKTGFDAELDQLKSIARDARTGIAAIEEKARTSSGIKSLKVGYNKVFGYYIEVSRANLHLVPPEFQRRQTLVNGERFITPELKELENQVLSASERIEGLEQDILRRVSEQTAAHAPAIMRTASTLAIIDACLSLASVAADEAWILPFVDEGDSLDIEDGRHPVVESVLGPGRFVPNSLYISNSQSQLLIITGPNMSGKSTYIRQAAILAIMAQIGSFLPAASARMGLIDRIFTRIGVTDDIAGGSSTFMVEMVETASILNQATPRSLAILDEIGRGTSTYDGLAIARSVAEFIHNNPSLGCKTLFATHYHEMTTLAKTLPRAKNLRVAVSEEGEKISFLYRILPGGADRSYGVHVARLAGMPTPVVERAWALLEELESARTDHKNNAASDNSTDLMQFSLFQAPGTSETLKHLAEMDTENMSPIEALNKLYELRGEAQQELNS